MNRLVYLRQQIEVLSIKNIFKINRAESAFISNTYVKMARFLYVGTFQLPDRNAAAQRVTGVAILLRQLGYDVVFLDLNKSITLDFTEDCTYHEGFEVYSIRYPNLFGEWLRHATIPEYVDEVLAKHNDWCGVIAYNYPGLALLRLKKLCLRRNLKLLADCTEWYALNRSLNPHKIATDADSFIRMRIAQKRCDGLIAISSFLTNYYKKHTTCVTLPPVIDKNNAKWTHRSKQGFGTSRRLCYIGSPGAGMAKDRLDVIIEALFKCRRRELSLEIAGITDVAYKKFFPAHQEILETLIGEGRLRFHGRLAHQEAVRLLKTADFTIFFREDNRMTRAGFPTKFVESISCGVPVITTLTSDLKNYLRNGRNGLVIQEPAGCNQIVRVFVEVAEMPSPPPVDDAIFDVGNYRHEMLNFLNEIKL